MMVFKKNDHLVSMDEQGIYTILLSVFSCIVVIRLLFCIWYQYCNFPITYEWSECFIKYTGGFVRRGLLGSIFYQLQHVMDIQIVWIVFSTALTATFFWFSFKFIRTVFTPMTTLCLFFSPGMFFFLTSQHIFARKDILILSLLLAGYQAVVGVYTRRLHLAVGMFLLAVLYGLAWCLHEVTFFLFPLCLFLLIRCKAPSFWKVAAFLLAFVLVVASLYLTLRYPGTVAMRDAMFRDWQEVFPNITQEYAMHYIGYSLRDALDMTAQYWKEPLFCLSYIVCLFLALMPVVLVYAIYPVHDICRAVLGKNALPMVYALALFPLIVLSVIIVDFGRTIAFFLIVYVLFLAAVFHIYQHIINAQIPTRADVSRFSLRYPHVFCLLALYVLAWRMNHWVLPHETLLALPF